MASSNVEIASTSKTNPDLPPQSSLSSISSVIADPSRNLVSITMDDLLKNMYSDAQTHTQNPIIASSSSSSIPSHELSSRTVDEVWKEIVSGGDQRRDPAMDREITLEDFLSKSGAVRDEDLRVPVVSEPVGGYAVDSTLNNNQLQIPSQQLEGPMVGGYASGIDGRIVGVGRGKRRAVVEEPVDKATQQKQRRMIKNRESAARSRERKQAYTLELESLVTQLEQERARLLREEVEHIKERSKQLKKKLIPISEKRRPKRMLRRVNSL
uniref:BZIP domain-containing protein n=1 Tax=Cucumis melo TaxID=3656 RepID=A0A9I9D7D7_CUCME